MQSPQDPPSYLDSWFLSSSDLLLILASMCCCVTVAFIVMLMIFIFFRSSCTLLQTGDTLQRACYTAGSLRCSLPYMLLTGQHHSTVIFRRCFRQVTTSIFIAHCLLGVSYPAVLLSEWVSVTIESEPSTNPADFDPMFPNLWTLPGDGAFFQSILQKCCLVTSLGPVWLTTIF